MGKHWYRNEQLNKNRLLSDDDVIPNGYTRKAYSDFQSRIHADELHNNFGKHHSEETKCKISDWNKGKIVSKESRQKMSESAKKRDWSNFHPNHKGENNPRYGVRYTMTDDKREKFISKRYATMKKNNSFNKSKPEEEFYQRLLESYDESEIVRQYSDKRYPFKCDFYIIPEDKFIECHYSWTHGDMPFNPESRECQELLEKWQSKTTGNDYYSQAIKTWTVRDVQKRKIAEENNLNIEFIYKYR